MEKLTVWIYPPGEAAPVKAGRLSQIGKSAAAICLFEYAPEYLAAAGAFALSPDLPLRKGEYAPQNGLSIHPVFADAMPDRWGRNIIDRLDPQAAPGNFKYLRGCGNQHRMGALAFTEGDAWQDENPIVDYGVGSLDELQQAARQLAANPRLMLDERLRRLLQPGSSAGGAQPKAVVRDGRIDWIAKFDWRVGEDFQGIVPLERESLDVAKRLGLQVAQHRQIELPSGAQVLLVRRFDRAAKGLRRHMVSARTLFAAYGVFADKDRSYPLLADIIRQWGGQPDQQCRELFRRMVFNIAIDNTDDHEKNHAFLFDGKHWNLSPMFDTHPQLTRLGYQSLGVGKLGTESSFENALTECLRFCLSKDEAEKEIQRIQRAVARTALRR